MYHYPGCAPECRRGRQGNTGFPELDVEIAHLTAILNKACRRLTEADVGALRESLIRLAPDRRGPPN